jgi:hypothetical protein
MGASRHEECTPGNDSNGVILRRTRDLLRQRVSISMISGTGWMSLADLASLNLAKT